MTVIAAAILTAFLASGVSAVSAVPVPTPTPSLSQQALRIERTLWLERVSSSGWQGTVSVEWVAQAGVATTTVDLQLWRRLCERTCVETQMSAHHVIAAPESARGAESAFTWSERAIVARIAVPARQVRSEVQRRALKVLSDSVVTVPVTVTAMRQVPKERHVLSSEISVERKTTTIEQGPASAQLSFGSSAFAATSAGYVAVSTTGVSKSGAPALP